MRGWTLCRIGLVAGALLLGPAPGAAAGCGEAVSVATHAGTTTRYSLARPPSPPAGPPVVLVLLPGGGGELDLDAAGCPRALQGNSLVRSLPHFHALGLATALVDVPSDHRGGDGLGGFRVAADHAADLGAVIADVRRRTGGAVWLVGTSRGAISAANAAARLTGPAAPEGLVLTSAVTSGYPGGRKAWAADTVFDLPLEAIRQPLLVVGHGADRCLRSPPERMGEIAARAGSGRKQVVTVAGGPGPAGDRSVDACAGRTPHGFLGQEREVAEGIARFVAGGRYEPGADAPARGLRP